MARRCASTDPYLPYSNCDWGGSLYAGRNYVYCKVLGAPDKFFGTAYIYNHWFLKTDVDMVRPGYSNPMWVSAYYLTGPKNSSNDTAFDENGNEIPNC
jgi:hypothetical protein